MNLNTFESNKAAEQMAKERSLAFDKWKWDNRWFSFENGYWYQTHEQGTAMSEKTSEQLYNQFIEQQQNK